MRTVLLRSLAIGFMLAPSLAWAQTGAPTAGPAIDPPQLYVAPFLGNTFAGDATSSGMAVGVAAGWRSRGWWGVEGDVASVPNFFEQTGFLTNRWVTSYMGNGLVHYGSARMSVFGSAGFGVLHIDLAEAGGLAAIKKTEPAFNVGAGGQRIWNNNVGVRVDVRYFRATGNTDDDANVFGLEVSKLHFWRASAAFVVAF